MDEPSQHSTQRTKFRRRDVPQVKRSAAISRCLKMRDSRYGTVQTRFLVRKALPAEEAQFGASQARAIKDKEIHVDDDWLMFLVPVTDPTGDFDPYDAPGG
jgi:hypothetical protein